MKPAPPFALPPKPAGSEGLTSSTPRWMKISLAGCAATAVAVFGAIALLIAVVFGIVKSTGAYTMARDRAAHDPRVVEMVGSPVEPGWWIIGTLRLDASFRPSNADLDFPVHGPKGRATVHVVASKERGTWKATTLEVVKPAGRAINLLEQPPQQGR